MKHSLKIHRGSEILFILVCVCFVGNVRAEESIEYVAEHLLEVPMDSRALAFPLTPTNTQNNEARFQLGYGNYTAGKLNNTVPMLGGQYFFSLNESWGLLAGAFYDRYQFSGKRGEAIGEVLVVNAPEAPNKFNVDIMDISGSGKYSGGSLALTLKSDNAWRWQFGYEKSNIDIKKFKVDFNTTNLTDNFFGSFDYASHYSINTLYVGVEVSPYILTENISCSPHLIIVRNSPRVGFQGRFTGPTFDYSGNTATNGRGKHIPDNYMGAGLSFEQISSGVRVDLGATIYTYALEPAGHKGISTPIFVTLTAPVF